MSSSTFIVIITTLNILGWGVTVWWLNEYVNTSRAFSLVTTALFVHSFVLFNGALSGWAMIKEHYSDRVDTYGVILFALSLILMIAHTILFNGALKEEKTKK